MNGLEDVAAISSNQGFAIAVGVVLIVLFSGIVIWIIKKFFNYFEREYVNHRKDMEKIIEKFERLMGEFDKRGHEHEKQMREITKIQTKQDKIVQYEVMETETTAKMLNELDLIKRNHYAKQKV